MANMLRHTTVVKTLRSLKSSLSGENALLVTELMEKLLQLPTTVSHAPHSPPPKQTTSLPQNKDAASSPDALLQPKENLNHSASPSRKIPPRIPLAGYIPCEYVHLGSNDFNFINDLNNLFISSLNRPELRRKLELALDVVLYDFGPQIFLQQPRLLYVIANAVIFY